MRFFRFLFKIPFTLTTIDFDKRWEGDVPGLSAEEVKQLQKRYPIKTKKRLINKIPFLFSIAQNISVLKSCIFCKPTIIPNEHKGVAYVRIHKSGSSSLVSALFSETASYKQSLDAVEWAAYHYYQQKPGLDKENFSYFTVVRNPFARLVSAYLNSYFEGDSFHYVYGCYLFGIFRKSFTFSQFVECVSLIPAPFLLDHIKPQTAVLNYLKIEGLKIFKLEDGNDQIGEFLGLDKTSFKQLNTSPAYDYRDFYDQGSLEKAAKVYAADIEAFGYTKELEDLKAYVAIRNDLQ